MKAMGAESDLEAVQLVGAHDALAALLLPSLQECTALGVCSAAQALEYLGGKLSQRGPRGFSERRRKSKVDEARDVLAHVILCHVPVVRRFSFWFFGLFSFFVLFVGVRDTRKTARTHAQHPKHSTQQHNNTTTHNNN